MQLDWAEDVKVWESRGGRDRFCCARCPIFPPSHRVSSEPPPSPTASPKLILVDIHFPWPRPARLRLR